MQTRLKNSLRLVWFGVVFLFFVAVMPTGRVSQADSSYYGTDMLPYMTINPTIAADSNDTMEAQMGSATPFNIPIKSLYASNIRGAGTSGVAAIDSNAEGSNVTIVMQSGDYTIPFKNNGSVNYTDLGSFSFVFSLGNSKYIEMNQPYLKIGAGDPNNTVKRTNDATKGVAIGKSASSGDAMYVDKNTQTNSYVLHVPQDIYVQIDLQAANADKGGMLTNLSDMKISEQFSLNSGSGYDGSTYFKTIMGALPFKITLNPQVSHITYLPQPITTKDTSTGAIITGTGSIAGDTIEYSLDNGVTWASTGAKVTDGNTWLWLVPESLGLSENDKVVVREADTAKDDSNTDDGTVVNPFSGMTDAQITVEEGKIADIINSGGDVDQITQQINDVLTNVTATTTATNSGFSLKMTKAGDEKTELKDMSDVDFLFTNGYKDTDASSETTISTNSGSAVANSALVRLISTKAQVGVPYEQLVGQKITWTQLTTSGQAFPDKNGQQPLTITPVTYGDQVTAGAMVAANDNYIYQMDGNDYNHGVDVVLVGQFSTFGLSMQVTKTIHIIALKPEKTNFEFADRSNFTFSLTNVPDSLNDARYTWQYTPKDSQTPGGVLTDATGQSLSIDTKNLTYYNDGDIYQLTITLPDGETFNSNPVALRFKHDQPLSFLKVPDTLHFTPDGGAGGISLKSALDGWKDYQPNATKTGPDGNSHDVSWDTHELSSDDTDSEFQIGALDDTQTPWSVTATLAPFVNTTTHQPLNPDGGTAALYLDFNIDTAKGMKTSQVSDYADNNPDHDDATIEATDYRKQPVYDDDKPVTVLGSFGDTREANFALMTKVSAKLDITSSPFASTGAYTSTLTWTLNNTLQ
ncbi:hypothetical protein [Lacticaseibacillus porcinae]|uniref:hypothetical protein n=1 Tax=Lacticaseibacillus porcinae TaxID=1123687 RepID=UPI000F7B7D50|nr:hypothetical protein [Lacticaseibacillus porcinae]